jgi:hypothetical protein
MSKGLTLAAFGILLALCTSGTFCLAGTVEGRVIVGQDPVAGVKVFAYDTLDFTRPPVAVAMPSDAQGAYRLVLPTGSYALFGWKADQSLFAFSGRNPVHVDDNSTEWAGLQAVPVHDGAVTAYDDEYSGAIEGRVTHQGQPVTGAHVSLYLDVSEDLKGQGYRISLPTEEDGYFRFDNLPESSYYLVARQRQDGQRVGPVREGDLYGLYPGNPLTARSGEVQQVTFELVAKLQDAEDRETFGRMSGSVLKGVVVDADQQGVAGVHVFAYTDRVIGHQRPAAMSTPTGPDGKFVVHLPAAGTYYVGARQAYGDSPAPGELFGMYEQTADHGLTVGEGETVDNLTIMVEPIELF